VNVGLLQTTAMRIRCPRPDTISQRVRIVVASTNFQSSTKPGYSSGGSQVR
jgi:hypothetical protein